MYGWEHKVEHMPTQLWEKQGEAMVHAKDTNTKVLHAGERCPLTSFDDFIAKHGKQRSMAKTHCATQEASQPQRSSGSSSGCSSEDGNDDIAQVDELSADGAHDAEASSDDECSNDSKSLASAQSSLSSTTAASMKNTESTAPLKSGSSSLSFSPASTSKRAPSRMGSDDEGDLGLAL